MSYRLAIDLGTTFTAAAVSEGAEPSMVGLGNRAMQIPSVLYLRPDGEFAVGEAAEQLGATDPVRLVREFKLRSGNAADYWIGGRSFPAEALTAQLLAWTVARCVERQGGPPTAVTLTHPATWGRHLRERFEQVAEQAGLPGLRYCTEPEAAAVQYAAQTRVPSGARVAVYDLGGGTFDVCVLEKTPDGFAVIGSPRGLSDVGGADFDGIVFEHVRSSLGDRLAALDLDAPDTVAGLARLRRDCVEAKELLSSETEVTVPVTLPGLATSVRVTRGELEAGIAEPLRETLEQTRSALRSADVRGADLHAVVLIGGSSRIPLVTELLQRELRVRVAVDAHPKHDVALGAARLGAPAATSRPPAPMTTRDPDRRPAAASLTRDPDYVAALAALQAEEWTRAGDLLAKVAARFPGEPRVLEPLGRARAGTLRARPQVEQPLTAASPGPAVAPMTPRTPTADLPGPAPAAATTTTTPTKAKATPKAAAPLPSGEPVPVPAAAVVPRAARSRPDAGWGPRTGSHPGRRRAVLVAAGVVVVALLVSLLLTRGRPAPPVVDPTATAPVTPFLAGPVKPPTVTGHRSGDRAVFTWDGYPGQQAGDSYQLRWTISGRTTEGGASAKPRAVREGSGTICLSVQVRASGVVRTDYSAEKCL